MFWFYLFFNLGFKQPRTPPNRKRTHSIYKKSLELETREAINNQSGIGMLNIIFYFEVR